MLRFAVLVSVALFAAPAPADDVIPGPVRAKVVRVVDGDTIAVLAHPWLGTTIETFVRVEGIDTPEKGARGKCAHERELAERASAFTAKMFPPGAAVMLSRIKNDKYGGRVVGLVATEDGRDLSASLIGAGLAKPYDGGKKSSWCGEG